MKEHKIEPHINELSCLCLSVYQYTIGERCGPYAVILPIKILDTGQGIIKIPIQKKIRSCLPQNTKIELTCQR